MTAVSPGTITASGLFLYFRINAKALLNGPDTKNGHCFWFLYTLTCKGEFLDQHEAFSFMWESRNACYFHMAFSPERSISAIEQ